MGEVDFQGWVKGIDNVSPEFELDKRALRSATNIDIDDQGRVRRRKGYTLAQAAADMRSLWTPPGASYALLSDNGALKKLALVAGTPTLTTLRTGLAAANVSYCEVNGDTYYSDGTVIGKVLNDGAAAAEWGLEVPASTYSVAETVAGGMDAGTYQVALVFVTASGEESGARGARTVNVAVGGGINLGLIPQPTSAEVLTVRVFLSPANGDRLYHHTDIPVGITTYNLAAGTLGRQIETQFGEAPPAGHIVRHYNGRIFIAVGDTLYYTDALRYGLVRRHTNFLRFSGRITMVEPGVDGLWVAAGNRTVFLPGTEPKQMAQITAYPAGAVEGASMVADWDKLSLKEPYGKVPVWLSRDGIIFAGLPNGAVQRLTSDRYAVDEYATATLALRSQPGLVQIVALLGDKLADNPARAQDAPVATVVTNGN
jgi:hypothetical protein